ncbi:MAG TPA: molybdenum cofactor biosynthesis protein MoaE, partial [Conexibacter sp.]|nr:molybdenum cofactor biosynthesis protein MoaE [Conexibacter sp.]
MVVRIRLFAQLRERAGRAELELDLPDGARVRDALAADAVASLADGLPLVMAVNREYADADAPLAAGDELALIPPVSGGAQTARTAAESHVALREEPLSLDALAARVRDPRAGAVVTFSGVTREVSSLDYEAYTEMALEQMRTIVAEAIARHGLCAAAAEHRVGSVPLSEASVIVAVSAP